MFQLPIEIQRVIYSYDSTYRYKYSMVLKSLDVGKLLTPRKASRLSNIMVVIVLLVVAYFVFSMGKKRINFVLSQKKMGSTESLCYK